MSNKYINTIIEKEQSGSAFFSTSDLVTAPAKALYTSSGLDTILTKKNIIKWGVVLSLGSIGLSVLYQVVMSKKNDE